MSAVLAAITVTSTLCVATTTAHLSVPVEQDSLAMQDLEVAKVTETLFY